MDADKLYDAANVVLTPVDEIPQQAIDAFHKADRIFFDLETTGLSPFRSEIALLQMYEPESKTLFLGRVHEDWHPQPWLTDLFKPSRTFIGHNIAAFDLHYLALAGIPWKKASYYDSLIAETLITTSGRSDVSKSLRASVRRRTGYEVDKNIEHGGWRNSQLRPDQIKYAAIDVLVLPGLVEEQIQKAEDSGQTPALDMEMAVLPVFSQMSLNGLPIDDASLQEYMRQMEVRVVDAEVLMKERLGTFNYGSPIQLRKALNSIGIELDSTAHDILVDQILFDPESDNARLLQAILDWRAPHKRTEMYGSEVWQAEHIEADGRIHARFWQIGADTTRVSSSDPNLQQVPKDGRWVFGHIPGHKIVSVDYSQIEVRISADVSNDDVLITLLEDEDVHTSIASQVFKCEKSDVKPKQRKLAKAMVFTLLFGGSYRRFYEYARINGSDMTLEEAAMLFKAFFDTFQGLWGMRQKAYAITRNRKVAVITLPNKARRVLVGRKFTPAVILNTTVQGTAAVGMKLGLIEAGKKGLDDYMGAVVHDEAVCCVPDDIAEDFANDLQKALIDGMSKVVRKCPVRAEIARNKDGSLPDFWLA
jgi:DNA polymerase-1